MPEQVRGNSTKRLWNVLISVAHVSTIIYYYCPRFSFFSVLIFTDFLLHVFVDTTHNTCDFSFKLTLYCEINDGDIWRLEFEVLLPLILVLSAATSSIILFSAANTSFCSSIMAWCLISFIESSRKNQIQSYCYYTFLHVSPR